MTPFDGGVGLDIPLTFSKELQELCTLTSNDTGHLPKYCDVKDTDDLCEIGMICLSSTVNALLRFQLERQNRSVF